MARISGGRPMRSPKAVTRNSRSVKVGKSDYERTSAGTRGNDEDAPEAAIRPNVIERPGAGLDHPFRVGMARAARYDQYLMAANEQVIAAAVRYSSPPCPHRLETSTAVGRGGLEWLTRRFCGRIWGCASFSHLRCSCFLCTPKLRHRSLTIAGLGLLHPIKRLTVSL
jgi:hypothetical protein